MTVTIADVLKDNRGRIEWPCSCVLWGGYYGAMRPQYFPCGEPFGPTCHAPEEIAKALEAGLVGKVRC